MFHKFTSRLAITGTLRCEGPIRVGAGKETEVTAPDMPVVRDVAGRPYIPGASMKGIVRSYLESIVRAAGGDRAACDPLDHERSCIPVKRNVDGERISFTSLKERCGTDSVKLAQLVEENSCLVCSVFGSQSIASHVYFDDLSVLDWFGQFQVRNGVSIDRDSGRASQGRLFDLEIVPSGTRFRFRAVLENCDEWKRGLLQIAIAGLQDRALTVGGARSRGFGTVTVDHLEYDLIDSADQLIQSLDQDGRMKGRTVTKEEIRSWVSALKKRLEEIAHVQA